MLSSADGFELGLDPEPTPYSNPSLATLTASRTLAIAVLFLLLLLVLVLFLLRATSCLCITIFSIFSPVFNIFFSFITRKLTLRLIESLQLNRVVRARWSIGPLWQSLNALLVSAAHAPSVNAAKQYRSFDSPSDTVSLSTVPHATFSSCPVAHRCSSDRLRPFSIRCSHRCRLFRRLACRFVRARTSAN